MEYYVLSLNRGNRRHIYDENKRILPELKMFKAVNGYDKQETIAEFKKLGIEYHNLDFKTYGTLACWITKVKMLKHQIDHKIPVVCFIEDDILLDHRWKAFTRERKLLLCDDVNIIRLCQWGEGYITSLEGAQRLMKIIKEQGVLLNIDNQLRGMNEKYIDVLPPALLMCSTNCGDCMATEKLPDDFASI